MMTTEQEKLEKLLKDNAFLDHIFHCIHDGIIMTDPEGRITFVNPSAEKILGISHEQLLGIRAIDIPVAMYSHHQEELPRRKKPFGVATRKQKEQIAQNVLLQRPDGKAVPVLFNVGTAEDGQMVAILTDNSEMMHKQQQMEEYFNLVAHDLRTPLTVILSYAEMIGQELPADSQTRSMINKIWEVGKQMKAMIELITDRMRLEADNYQLNKTDIQLIAFVHDIASQHSLDDTSPHIHVDIEENLQVHADANLLQRALHNLLSNAAKHSPANSVIEIRCWGTAHGIVLAISDQGQGIEPEDQPYVFDPFFITSVGKQKGGIGLGLNITDKIVQVHGGHLYVCSQKGAGTTFAMFLPRPAGG